MKKTMVDGIDLNPLQKPKCCQSNHGASSPIPPDGKPNPSLQQKKYLLFQFLLESGISDTSLKFLSRALKWYVPLDEAIWWGL